MRLLLSILAAVFVLVPAGANAQRNGPTSVPPTESARIVGDAALEAAAEGRCEVSLRLLGSIPRRHRSYRAKVAADPEVRACRRDAAIDESVPADEEARDARSLSLQATTGAWGAMAVGLLLSESASGDGSTKDLGEALFLAGAIGSLVAPSFGHWSRGNVWTRGMTMRTLAVAGGALAGRALLVVSAGGCDGGDTCRAGEPMSVIAIVAASLYVIGTLDDIWTAGRPARREPRWQVTPTVMTAPAGPVAGLAAAGRF